MKLGPLEITLMVGLALVLFGPAKLPELGKSIGQAISEFKTQVNKVTDDIKDDSDEESRD